MPRAGFIRALFIQLRSFKIDRSINHFIPATGTVNFCPESDDIPCHKKRRYRRKPLRLGKAMSRCVGRTPAP